MSELGSEERIIRTLELRETDRVPTFEWYIDKKVIEALLPGSNYEKFCYVMNIDAICIECDYENKYLDGGLIEDEWKMIKKDTGEAHTFPLDGPVRTMKDAEQYIPPDPHKPGRYTSIEKAIKEHKGKKALILHLNDVFSIPSRLMPFETFLIKLMEEPEIVKIALIVNLPCCFRPDPDRLRRNNDRNCTRKIKKAPSDRLERLRPNR